MFPDFPLSPVTIVDLVLLAGLMVLHPLWSFLSHQAEKRAEARGQPRPLIHIYRRTLLVLWGMGLAVMAGWIFSGRSLSELGLGFAPTLLFVVSCAAVAIVIGLFVVQVVSVSRSAKERAQVKSQIEAQGRVSKFLPRTPQELGTFRLVSLSAGVVEEIVYRGFLIWAFAHWMHPAAAAALALAVFVAVHFYQESFGALARVALFGGVAVVLVMISGSLLPAIALHIAVDLASGETTHIAFREETETREA
jgi:membrane protease YdiL (CAAX protease family)